MGVVASFGYALSAYWLKVLVDGAVERQLASVLAAPVALGLTSALVVAGNRAGARWGTEVQEKVGFLVDQRLIELCGSVSGTEHHEGPEYQQRVDLLRSERGVFAGSIAAVVATVNVAVWGTTSMTLLLTVHPVLILLALFAIPSLLLTPRTTEVRQRAKEATVEDARVARHLFEVATGPAAAKEVRIFGLADQLVDRHRQAWDHDDEVRRRADLRAAMVAAAGWAAYGFGYVGARLFVVLRAVQHPDQTSIGDVLMVFNLSRQVNGMVERAATTLAWLGDSLKGAGRLLWLEAYDERNRQGPASSAAVPARLVNGIRLTDVSFRYPGTQANVLRDLDLHLPAGSTVAIVGENGAGKSTLVKLLCRFYEPTQGCITVDHVDLQRLDVDEWRRRVSGCFQDFVRFELLAREAVGIGDLDRLEDISLIEAALGRANAEDLSRRLSRGLDTQLGPSFDAGEQLSGGQWQKVALARAMMRAPLLLVLDEPTVSLDASCEQALFEGYAAAACRAAAGTGAITLVVSHRFSTVSMADLIVVLDHGQVVEVGSHDALMAGRKLYSELYRVQASSYR